MKQVVKKKRASANNVSTEKLEYTLLVDGNSLLKMSLVDKRMNNEGKEYGAVFLFLRQLGQLLQKKDFNYCIVCWDGYNSGILRYNIYEDYKANRDKHYELASGMSDYDKYISDFMKRTIRYYGNKNKEVKRAETDDELFQRQRAILQDILENLYVKATTPPSGKPSVLSGCTIYVPTASVDAYKTAWPEYANKIVGYDF